MICYDRSFPPKELKVGDYFSYDEMDFCGPGIYKITDLPENSNNLIFIPILTYKVPLQKNILKMERDHRRFNYFKVDNLDEAIQYLAFKENINYVDSEITDIWQRHIESFEKHMSKYGTFVIRDHYNYNYKNVFWLAKSVYVEEKEKYSRTIFVEDKAQEQDKYDKNLDINCFKFLKGEALTPKYLKENPDLKNQLPLEIKNIFDFDEKTNFLIKDSIVKHKNENVFFKILNIDCKTQTIYAQVIGSEKNRWGEMENLDDRDVFKINLEDINAETISISSFLESVVDSDIVFEYLNEKEICKFKNISAGWDYGDLYLKLPNNKKLFLKQKRKILNEIWDTLNLLKVFKRDYKIARLSSGLFVKIENEFENNPDIFNVTVLSDKENREFFKITEHVDNLRSKYSIETMFSELNKLDKISVLNIEEILKIHSDFKYFPDTKTIFVDGNKLKFEPEITNIIGPKSIDYTNKIVVLKGKQEYLFLTEVDSSNPNNVKGKYVTLACNSLIREKYREVSFTGYSSNEFEILSDSEFAELITKNPPQNIVITNILKYTGLKWDHIYKTLADKNTTYSVPEEVKEKFKKNIRLSIYDKQIFFPEPIRNKDKFIGKIFEHKNSKSMYLKILDDWNSFSDKRYFSDILASSTKGFVTDNKGIYAYPVAEKELLEEYVEISEKDFIDIVESKTFNFRNENQISNIKTNLKIDTTPNRVGKIFGHESKEMFLFIDEIDKKSSNFYNITILTSRNNNSYNLEAKNPFSDYSLDGKNGYGKWYEYPAHEFLKELQYIYIDKLNVEKFRDLFPGIEFDCYNNTITYENKKYKITNLQNLVIDQITKNKPLEIVGTPINVIDPNKDIPLNTNITGLDIALFMLGGALISKNINKLNPNTQRKQIHEPNH